MVDWCNVVSNANFLFGTSHGSTNMTASWANFPSFWALAANGYQLPKRLTTRTCTGCSWMHTKWYPHFPVRQSGREAVLIDDACCASPTATPGIHFLQLFPYSLAKRWRIFGKSHLRVITWSFLASYVFSILYSNCPVTYHRQVILSTLASRTEVLPQGDSDANENDVSLCLLIYTFTGKPFWQTN